MAYIIGICGDYGNGKTLTSVIKAQQWAAASGAKLFSNFPMRNAYIFDHYTDWYRVADCHGSIIIFDESQSNFDNRTWGGQGQISMTQVINYVRKMNCLFIFVLPSYNNIDNRIREKTDILIECFKNRETKTITNLVYEYGAKEYGQKGKLINKWRLPYSSQKKIFDLKIYSSHSMVHRFPTPPTNKVNDFFAELDQRHEAALKRVYGSDYLKIETLAKEDLLNVI